MRVARSAAALGLALLAAFLTATPIFSGPVRGPRATVTIGGRPVNDWTYQLQGRRGQLLSLEALGATAFDLAVIDYSADGTADNEFSAKTIAALRASLGGEKIVLAYMSIGEAEDYRFYFDPRWIDARGRPTPKAPSWLAPSNPEFPDNYKARYWETDWQRIIFGVTSGPAKSYLDRILDQGFDGVYLDIIDAFEFFGPDGESHERPTAAADMVDFVAAIADYARMTRDRPGFLVVPQNGSGIINLVDAAARQRYFAAIDAIGAEDTFFFGPRANNNRFRPQEETIVDLAVFQANGKPVLAVDYVTGRGRVNRFYGAASAQGYVPYATVRALDRVTINRGHEPD